MHDRVSSPAPVRRPVGVRTLVLGGMPMLVADVPTSPEGELVLTALRDAGLRSLPAIVGVRFPPGASVGLLLEGQEVRLVDERETTLLRLARTGLAPEWVDVAVRMRGTMLAVARDLGIEGLEAGSDLGAALDAAARDGRVDGAIVGVSDRRPRLPLVF